MGPRATGRPAAFFDLDKTIIAKSSTLAFSRSFQAGGLISRRAVLRSAYAQFVYLVGGADHDRNALAGSWATSSVTPAAAASRSRSPSSTSSRVASSTGRSMKRRSRAVRSEDGARREPCGEGGFEATWGRRPARHRSRGRPRKGGGPRSGG